MVELLGAAPFLNDTIKVKREGNLQGDLPLCVQKPVDNFFEKFEIKRKAQKVSVGRLCRVAGMQPCNYYRLKKSAGDVRPVMVRRLETALMQLQRGGHLRVGTVALEFALYRGFFISACRVYAADPAAMDAVLRETREHTGNLTWRLASHIRWIALYATVTVGDLSGARVARVVGLTKQAISHALKKIEDMRDEPAFETTLNAIITTTLGDHHD